jgi:hypothetical protein
MAGHRKAWSDDMRDYERAGHPWPAKYPALVHLPSGLIEPLGTNTVDQARSNLLARIAEIPPTPMPYGIETPVLVLPSANTGTPAYGIVVDSSGQLVTYEDHASPRPDAAERQRRIAEAITNQVSIVDALKALKTTMTNNIAQAQAIDPASFTGAQKTQVQALRKAMIDNAQAVNALRKTLLKFYKVTED